MNKSAQLSKDRVYRYALWREWGHGSYALFIGLNPSTADEETDDPTIRRCMRFAKDWGYDGLCMVNLFAFRATDPAIMLRVADPIGPANDEWLYRLSKKAGLVVAAWGAHGNHMQRADKVRLMISNMHYLRLTKEGHPGHPLYIPADTRPTKWEERSIFA